MRVQVGLFGAVYIQLPDEKVDDLSLMVDALGRVSGLEVPAFRPLMSYHRTPDGLLQADNYDRNYACVGSSMLRFYSET